MSDSKGAHSAPKKFRRRGTQKGQHFRFAATYRNFVPADIMQMSERQLERLWMKLAFPLTEGSPYCPKCGSTEYTLIKTRKQYNCCGCGRRYSNTSGTIFACRKKPIREILYALAQFQNHSDCYVAAELTRQIKITYKSAWVWAHKFRQLMADARLDTVIDEDVAIDGAYFGGVRRNANILKKRNDHRLAKFRIEHKKKVVVIIKGRVRNNSIIAKVFDRENQANDWIRETVNSDLTIYTDEANHWTELGLSHEHRTVNHKQAYKLGDCDTNAAESFFATLRIASRVHRSISRDYFLDYVLDQVWRRTTKHLSTNFDRFMDVAKRIGSTQSKFRGYWQKGAMA